jgi:hypothetical protein
MRALKGASALLAGGGAIDRGKDLSDTGARFQLAACFQFLITSSYGSRREAGTGHCRLAEGRMMGVRFN